MTDSARTRIALPARSVEKRRALHAIAVFEGIKGIAALAALLGAVNLMHHDVRHLAVELIGHFGLNPDDRYVSILLHYADLLPGADMRSLIVLGLAYSFVRLLEAYGVWNDRAWGAWLGALSGGLYIPFEVGHLMHRLSIIGAVVLAANAVVVCLLVLALWRRRT